MIRFSAVLAVALLASSPLVLADGWKAHHVNAKGVEVSYTGMTESEWNHYDEENAYWDKQAQVLEENNWKIIMVDGKEVVVDRDTLEPASQRESRGQSKTIASPPKPKPDKRKIIVAIPDGPTVTIEY